VDAGGLQGSRLDDWCTSEVVVENGLAVGLEDRFGGHCVSGEIEREGLAFEITLFLPEAECLNKFCKGGRSDVSKCGRAVNRERNYGRGGGGECTWTVQGRAE